ncbi:hypothetical protein BCIN_06g02790 [Botrytis cinerea B05.10]|uniref:Uncharacterized protein n=1 Tax=Botryotinia fuckeliana (strain B05.10) TaxID=332648 RepID=A0A384JJN3_BOTFB|nr:hypothetical protein BCIN_06g02790 [Botrytis cinerea B05.10]ATZ50795.1 hypothetical protein BCIN_06g02790 [Botrytis cinerea B05.10]
MYSLFRVPKLHFNPQVHTERLIVFLAFRKDFLLMSYGDLLHYDKKKNRDELLKSFDPQYIEQHLHGISFKHMCDLVKDMWTARYFHPNSEITRFFEGASFERQQDPAFRRLINVPPLGEALESDIWRLNHQPYYKPRITKSGRIRKLHSTRLRFLPIREPFGPDLMLNFSPESGPFQPFLGPYEDDYECSTALPFALQHSILTTLQDLTEESLFSFASRYFPGYLALNFKTCPKSMELNTWRSHLHMNAPYIRQNLTSGFVIDDLHFFLHRLETIIDLIVRRKQGIPIEAINSMCADSICLARALGDPRAFLLGIIQEKVLMVSETLLQIQPLPLHFSSLEIGLTRKCNLQIFIQAISASRILIRSAEGTILYSERYYEITNMLHRLEIYNEEKRAPPTYAPFYY